MISGSRPAVIIYAELAHLVERHLAKVEVAGSSPVIRSMLYFLKVCGSVKTAYCIY